MASDIDVFIRPDQAVELCRGVAQVFGELGNRENRGLARMRYLAEELGPEGFRAALDERTNFALPPAARELTTAFRGDHVGVHPQKQPGLFYVGLLGPGGPDARHRPDRAGAPRRDVRRRWRAHRDRPELHRLRRPRGEARRPAGRTAHADVLTVPRTLRAGRRRLHRLRVLPLRRRGDQGASREVGADSRRTAVIGRRRHGRQRDDAGVIRMHFSGCSASCAQPQIADIGFRGDIAHVDEHIEEAVDIGLGGSLGPDAAFIDWVVGALPVERVPDALLRVVTRYREEHRPGEPFHRWARRTDSGRSAVDVGRHGGGGDLVKRYRLREQMNGITEPPGKVWFWELEAGVIHADRCIQCGTCVAVCPSNSIGIDEDTNLPELVKMCTGCSLCWDFCPRGGLRYEALWPPSTVAGRRGRRGPTGPGPLGLVGHVLEDQRRPAGGRARCGRGLLRRPGQCAVGRRAGRRCGQRPADRAAGRRRDRRRPRVEAECRSRRAVEGHRHHRDDGR